MIIILTLSILGGCNMTEKFETEERGIDYLLQSLKERYGKEFIIVGNINFDTELRTNLLIADVSPKDNPEQIAWARVTGTGRLADQYHQYYFKEEAENLLKDVCKTKDYIQEYKVELHGAPAEKLWNKDNSLEEYLSKSKSFIDVIVYVENGKSNEEYAELIGDWIKVLYDIECKIDCRVRVKGEEGEHEIFFYPLYQVDLSKMTNERILKEIEHSFNREELRKEINEMKKERDKERDKE